MWWDYNLSYVVSQSGWQEVANLSVCDTLWCFRELNASQIVGRYILLIIIPATGMIGVYRIMKIHALERED